MNKPIIGLNVAAGINVNALEAELASVKKWGYDCAEIALDAFPLIISGKENKKFVEYAGSILKKAGLHYSAHIGVGLDLRSRDQYRLHMDALLASIDICARLSLNPLVLHFEQDSHNPEVENQFIEGHKKAALYAQQKGIMLCLENIEVEHYKPVLEAVKLVGLANFKMNLDLGHLYIASKYFGFSFEEAIRECAPYVGHCHINDNTGIFEPMRLENFDLYRALPMGYRITFGRGDIHMPPFYGEVPIEFSIGILKAARFSGKYICEYQSRIFTPFNQRIQKHIREVIERQPAASEEKGI
ncbi:MAG TPA: hypothetical protein DD738_14760 [Ruminiclostridium sp.]|nr:hypothetical protein [Ruminiclostridium sp.]